MYGILLESVVDAIVSEYGQHIWDEVQEFLNIDRNQLLTHSLYSDVMFSQIVDALILFRKDGDYGYYMEFFGRKFVSYFSNYGFEKILRVAGRNFRDFLHSIDQLHDSNRFTFPKMKSPLFFVTDEDCDGLYLHYQSRRRGFKNYVIGQIKECAERFYNMSVQIKQVQDVSTSELKHIIFRIDFDNSCYRQVKSKKSLEILEAHKSLNSIDFDLMLTVFPFSFGFDKNLRIKHLGSAFEKLFGDSLNDTELCRTFTLLRPKLELDWKSTLFYLNSIIYEFETHLPTKKALSPTKRMKLTVKGQMKLCEEIGLIFFLGHPVITSVEQLYESGLYLNDLNQFDFSAEVLVTELQHNDELKKAFDTQHAFFKQLQATKSELNLWRRKSRQLLYSMLPVKIAKQIENGVQPNTICETYNQVTIMFAYTDDFKSIFKDPTIEPVQIVDFINSALTLYDKVVSSYDKVLKIETKADGSYMIVSGIDSNLTNEVKSFSSIHRRIVLRNRLIMMRKQGSLLQASNSTQSPKKDLPDYNQVELVSEVALEILEQSQTLENRMLNNSSQLKIQIGIHTGPVVAGIVGLSTIQFCLFGDTVNTSSRMCTNSQVGRILISESSQKFLEKSKYFATEFRDSISVKGKGVMNVYWLTRKLHLSSSDNT